MPLYLRVPGHRAGGPDGQGWNRIALGSLAGDQCALRPRDYSHLRESQDTRRARYGGYGPCTAEGDCGNCPVFQSAPRRLDSLDDCVLVRVGPGGRAYLMNRPEDGWASLAVRWNWEDLARLDGWTVGRVHRDEHSDGFWIHRVAPTTEEGKQHEHT